MGHTHTSQSNLVLVLTNHDGIHRSDLRMLQAHSTVGWGNLVFPFASFKVLKQSQEGGYSHTEKQEYLSLSLCGSPNCILKSVKMHNDVISHSGLQLKRKVRYSSVTPVFPAAIAMCSVP